MTAKRLLAPVLLAAMAAFHAAPLAKAVQSPVASCCKRKGGCCCKTSGAGWSSLLECPRQCRAAAGLRLTNPSVAPAAGESLGQFAPQVETAQAPRSGSGVPGFPAFLYQRPPPDR